LLGGVTQAMFAGTEGVMQHVKAGKLRALAVGTKKRLAAFPDIPSVAETLPEYDVVAWHGLIAPKGVPPEIITRLNAELNEVLKGKDMEARFAPNGLTPGSGTAAEFGNLIKEELVRYAGVIQRAGIKAE
jgi:tripartite-type tricarboxylate transporter receptor subunit TctC